MKKFPVQKVGRLLFFFSLIIVTIACNIPGMKEVAEEAMFEKCYPVNRNEYESAAAELGQVPRTPKYPDSAVYEVCFMNDGDVATSIRMTEDFALEEVDPDSIPVGNYEGVITDTEMATKGLLLEWEEQGTVESNEISLNVAADGKVTGQFLYVKLGNILVSTNGGDCVDSNDQYFVGEASGQLTESTGSIVFTIQHTFVSKLTAGCSIGPDEETIVEEVKQHFNIVITGYELIGTSVYSETDGHPIKATFRLVQQ